MSSLGFNSKALVISIAVHAAIAAGFAIPYPFGQPERPEFQIISVNLSTPEIKQKTQPPPPKKVEQPKKETPKPKPPKPKPEKPKERVQPKETQPKQNDKEVEKRIDEEPAEPEEVISYAEGGSQATKETEFSHAEFSGAFDSPGFEYPDWNYRGFEKIARAWHNRAFSTRPLFCTVHFYVLRSGRVHSIQIKEASGNPVYDRGCKQAVERAAPLPPLPRDFPHEEVGISLVFPFKP